MPWLKLERMDAALLIAAAANSGECWWPWNASEPGPATPMLPGAGAPPKALPGVLGPLKLTSPPLPGVSTRAWMWSLEYALGATLPGVPGAPVAA